MSTFTKLCVTLSIFVSLLASSTNAHLTTNFYCQTCPSLETIVRNEMIKAIQKENRIGASILRLFFHDCFVNGCDGSILLDDTATFTGEKNAIPNKNSARGFEVIDAIKTKVEAACSATVSCADILALAARDGVVLLGGPTWTVPVGRRDARTASQSDALNQIPRPSSNLATLIKQFQDHGLTATDLTALSGAHTIGLAHCVTFKDHLYNDTNIDTNFATLRKKTCPISGGDTNLAPLDVLTTTRFDNNYYKNLVGHKGLFRSDQVLFNKDSQDNLVSTYSANGAKFYSDFALAMIKLSKLSPLLGTNGEIRKNCRLRN
jgi:peroxidase